MTVASRRPRAGPSRIERDILDAPAGAVTPPSRAAADRVQELRREAYDGSDYLNVLEAVAGTRKSSFEGT